MNNTIIIKPVVTEKSMQSNGPAKFTFMVAAYATKTDIKAAFKEAYGVNVVSVSTSKIKGKRKRIGARRVEVREEATKKATIMLRKGEKLSIFESGEEKETKKKKK
ncbi:MAG TPA: 50S ribosomal protein L23 [Candidatus Saccharimonadales bacterium]|nr:50S ribosomal protein L23 [Candidatus Saccharimonadales bacterium]